MSESQGQLGWKLIQCELTLGTGEIENITNKLLNFTYYEDLERINPTATAQISDLGAQDMPLTGGEAFKIILETDQSDDSGEKQYDFIVSKVNVVSKTDKGNIISLHLVKEDSKKISEFKTKKAYTGTGDKIIAKLFEDAGVDMPEEGATWDDWADALRVVKSELGLTSGLAMDRTAHRWAGPAFSYGAKFHENGVPILVDEGFRDFAETFVGWHEEGLMPAEGWPAGGGTAYRNAAPLFLDGTVAMHMSGSWMLNNYDTNITDFEWKVVPIPCGTGGCGAMPGGSGIVAFKSTKHPEVAASFVDFLSQAGRAGYFAANTRNITAHQGLQKAGIDYPGVSARVSEGLSTFAANAGKAAESTPQAYWFQGYNKNFAIYGIVPDYITKAITGEMSLDDALAAIDADVAAKIAE